MGDARDLGAVVLTFLAYVLSLQHRSTGTTTHHMPRAAEGSNGRVCGRISTCSSGFADPVHHPLDRGSTGTKPSRPRCTGSCCSAAAVRSWLLANAARCQRKGIHDGACPGGAQRAGLAGVLWRSDRGSVRRNLISDLPPHVAVALKCFIPDRRVERALAEASPQIYRDLAPHRTMLDLSPTELVRWRPVPVSRRWASR